ncbi:MAG: hypothetical protein PHQ03_08095 [Methylococcales bacterium]|nr:hypothetical protein [Methylococcales bacterium]
MKKLVAFLLALNCVSVNADERYAHEYSSERGDERENRGEWLETERYNQAPRYQQNYRQPPIQIYLAPNQNSYSRDERHHRHSNDQQFREEHYWRERREELEQQPQRPYRDNSFYQDENHW